MAAKLTADLCYLVGLTSKNVEPERAALGVTTKRDEILEKFVKTAVKLGIDTKKLLIEENEEGVKHAYFYHSKLAKQAREIAEKETIVFRFKNEFAANYLAGIFDANGHVVHGKVTINGLNSKDQLMLQNLGIHTRYNIILNISGLVALIKGHSVLLDSMSLKA